MKLVEGSAMGIPDTEANQAMYPQQPQQKKEGLGVPIAHTVPLFSIVVSSDAVGRLPIKLAAPFTDWKPRYAPNVWHVRIDHYLANSLPKQNRHADQRSLQ